VRKSPYDVQRDLPAYRAAVEFRNAVEQMLARHGRLEDPEHVFWGFAPITGHWPGRGPGTDDDGLAGSRVPRRPPGGFGAEGAEAQVPFEAEVEVGPIAI
jgi:hypothetical protein